VILAAVAMLLLAIALVVAELVVPSHGLLAILAAIAAIISVFMAAKVSIGLGLFFGTFIFIATPFFFYWAIRLYPQTPVGKRIMLQEPADNQAFTAESARLAQLVGQQGTALTVLRPAGSIDIGGNRINAQSEADVIDPGTPVQVIRVSGLKVFVKPIDA
jgi:membrane-bound ClpP family serine protease